MSDNTRFTGVLKFKNDITIAEIVYLKKLLREDIRNHDLQLLNNFSGIICNNSMIEQINHITSIMKIKFPSFELE